MTTTATTLAQERANQRNAAAGQLPRLDARRLRLLHPRLRRAGRRHRFRPDASRTSRWPSRSRLAIAAGRRVHLRPDGRPLRPAPAADDRPRLLLDRSKCCRAWRRTMRRSWSLRALFGIGMGGEWGVGASLAMENVPRRWRGLLSGLPAGGLRDRIPAGGLRLLLRLPALRVARRCSSSAALPALLALFVRIKVKESEVWREHQARDLAHLRPGDRLALEALPLHRRDDDDDELRSRTARRTCIRRSCRSSAASRRDGGRHRHHLQRRRDPRRHRLRPRTRTVAAGGGDGDGPHPGAFVRRRSGPSRPPRRCSSSGAFMMQFMVQGAWGVIPAHINELSPDSVRGFLPGFAYQCGVLIASSRSPTSRRSSAST